VAHIAQEICDVGEPLGFIEQGGKIVMNIIQQSNLIVPLIR
jgi:hypothetical protein